MKTDSLIRLINILIIIFLTLQVVSAGFSVALSSISFGIWGSLWIFNLFTKASRKSFRTFLKSNPAFNFFIIAYILSEIISRTFAIIPEGAFTGLKRMLLFIVLWGTVTSICTKKQLYYILASVLIGYAVISSVEIVRLISDFGDSITKTEAGDMRIDYFGYPVTNGEIKLLIFVSSFPLLFLNDKFILKRKYLILILFPIFISMILTQSRNVMLAMILTILIYLFIQRKKIFFIILIILPVIFFILPKNFQERIVSISDYSHPSNYSRLVMWETGLRIFADHPIIGTGDNEITRIYKSYKEPKYHGEGSHLHSNPIMILATNGLIGFLAFLGLSITLFSSQYSILKNETDTVFRMMITGSILSMISFHISGIFEWSFGDWEVLTVFLFISAIPFSIKNINEINGQRT